MRANIYWELTMWQELLEVFSMYDLLLSSWKLYEGTLFSLSPKWCHLNVSGWRYEEKFMGRVHIVKKCWVRVTLENLWLLFFFLSFPSLSSLSLPLPPFPPFPVFSFPFPPLSLLSSNSNHFTWYPVPSMTSDKAGISRLWTTLNVSTSHSSPSL